jgi:hypothetical protein
MILALVVAGALYGPRAWWLATHVTIVDYRPIYTPSTEPRRWRTNDSGVHIRDGMAVRVHKRTGVEMSRALYRRGLNIWYIPRHNETGKIGPVKGSPPEMYLRE